MAWQEGWRRVGRARFVPPEASAWSRVYVQWRREDGAWVVDAIADEGDYVLPLLGRPVGMISRDTSLVPEGMAYAAGTAWYRDNEPLTLDGYWFVKYGYPRHLDRGALVRKGVVGRVSMYMEAGDDGYEGEGVMYAAVAPGEYQPYMGFGREPCN